MPGQSNDFVENIICRVCLAAPCSRIGHRWRHLLKNVVELLCFAAAANSRKSVVVAPRFVLKCPWDELFVLVGFAHWFVKGTPTCRSECNAMAAAAALTTMTTTVVLETDMVTKQVVLCNHFGYNNGGRTGGLYMIGT